MTLLILVGIAVFAGCIIGSLVKANTKIDSILSELRTIIENQDEERHERQMEWEKQYDNEDNSQSK